MGVGKSTFAEFLEARTKQPRCWLCEQPEAKELNEIRRNYEMTGAGPVPVLTTMVDYLKQCGRTGASHYRVKFHFQQKHHLLDGKTRKEA